MERKSPGSRYQTAGWKEKDGQLLPIPTDQSPARDYLTEGIRCSGAIAGSMAWTVHLYAEIAKVSAAPIPLN